MPNFIYDAFYKDKIKVVPELKILEEYLTPLALGVWIMDDGGKASAGLKLSTNSFTYEEVLLLCEVLNKKYKLEARPNKGGELNQYIIYIPGKSMKILDEIVKEYIHPTMRYKVK